MTLLQTMYLVVLLPPWTANLGTRLVKAPKLMLSDTGLLASLLEVDEQRVFDNSTLLGSMLENFVVMEIRKQISWSKKRPQMFHFRTHSGCDAQAGSPPGLRTFREPRAWMDPGLMLQCRNRRRTMSITIEAVYEAGILKPLAPLPELAERSRVRVTIEPASKPVPKVRRSAHGRVDNSRENEWLRQHENEYRGQWVVLDGDRLVGHTPDTAAAKAIIEQARAEGVLAPFVTFINEDSKPI